MKKQRRIVFVKITDVGTYFQPTDTNALIVGQVYGIDTKKHNIVGTIWKSSGMLHVDDNCYDCEFGDCTECVKVKPELLDAFCGAVKAEYVKGYEFRNL